MGLDMYLSAKRYLSNHNETDKDISATINALTVKNPKHRIIQVECEVMYWRKANAIHKWFVNNCQNGVDNCQEHWVLAEQLRGLVALCSMVLKNPALAMTLLPPQAGFFFGSTEINDGFISDLEETVEVLGDFLTRNDVEDWTFIYRSSW
jgi:hypothetical protein